jgi:hypothetical protein
MTTPAKSPRRHKTPQQRAQEQLDIATRLANRLTTQAKKARADLARLDRERDTAVVRRDYLAAHPDLQHTTTEPSTTRNQSGDTTA